MFSFDENKNADSQIAEAMQGRNAKSAKAVIASQLKVKMIAFDQYKRRVRLKKLDCHNDYSSVIRKYFIAKIDTFVKGTGTLN